MKTSVFRKSSLEQLSSPEQLDQLMRVATPKGWVVLLSLVALIGVAVVWGIFGRVSVTVKGDGILMKSGGILNIQHLAGGMIKEVKVRSGDVVHQGEVVARVSQLDIVNKINETRIKLRELERRRTRTQIFSAYGKLFFNHPVLRINSANSIFSKQKQFAIAVYR